MSRRFKTIDELLEGVAEPTGAPAPSTVDWWGIIHVASGQELCRTASHARALILWRSFTRAVGLCEIRLVYGDPEAY